MHFKFCPHCGSKLVKKEIGDEGRIPYCEKCKLPLWDMFTTSVICAVINEENEVALLFQDYVSKENCVLVAGIMQMGETAEKCVIREVKEELGLDICDLKYIQSYDYKKKEMLMLGFEAKTKKAPFKLSNEVNGATWVHLSKAHQHLSLGGIAYQLVKTIQEKNS